MILARFPSPRGPQPVLFSSPILISALFYSLAARVIAHEHHEDEIPEGEAISADPIVALSPPLLIKLNLLVALTTTKDTILWVHIGIQILSFGLIFPTGMVLGVR